MATSIIEYKGGKELINLKDETLRWAPIHFAKLARNAAIIDLLKQNGAIDTPPIFSVGGLKAIVEGVRNTMRHPEKMVDTVSGGFAALSGATITFSVGKITGLDQLRFATQLSTKGAIWAANTFVIKSIFKEWAALPIAESKAFDSFQDTYCKDVITDKITHPNQVISLRHADMFLSLNEKDYLTLGDSCKETKDTELTKFNEFGFNWTLCSSLIKANEPIHEDL